MAAWVTRDTISYQPDRWVSRSFRVVTLEDAGLLVAVAAGAGQGDPLGHPDVRQAYQADVGHSLPVDEISEVFVQCNQHPVFRFG